MLLSDLPVGALVKDTGTTYNGENIIFRVLEHGHAGDPANTTALEFRDIISLKCFDAKEPNNSNSDRQKYGNNRYLYSNLLQWLNSSAVGGSWYSAQHEADQAPDSTSVTNYNPYASEAGFLSNFSDGLKAALRTVSKTTAKNTVTDGGGSEVVSSKIFLLSGTEVGLGDENGIAEGSIYEYYSSNNTDSQRLKNVTQGCYDNAGGWSNKSFQVGLPWWWWLRTLHSSISYYVRFVYNTGAISGGGAFNGNVGLSPAFCISSDLSVSDTPDADGIYTLLLEEPQTSKIVNVYGNYNGVSKIASKLYVNINGQSVLLAEGIKPTPIYGAEWRRSSAPAWTRTDDAALFVDANPYYVGMAGTPSSPFDNISPWKDMVMSERTGGTMVAIPKFYYKLEQPEYGSLSIKIIANDYAAYAVENGYSVSPAHIDRGDGIGERDVVYVGRYHCDTSSHKSITGVLPYNNITRSEARTAIHNLGANIWQMDFATQFTIWLLYLVEFADWNSQAKIGYGCGNDSAPQSMGYTDLMPYHTGTTQSARNTYGLGTQYRNIEGLWDNVWDWLDGCYYNSSGLNIILNPNSFSDSSGGTAVGIPSNGYPSTFSVSNAAGFPMFYPLDASGSATTYMCDFWGYSNQFPCLEVGGNYSHYASFGLFSVGANGATVKNDPHGCRLMELP